jgi:Flp pilus assembly protein CpaB
MSRLRPGTVIVLVFASFFAIAGAFVVRGVLQSNEPLADSESKQTVTRYVPVASSQLPVGRKVALGDIAVLSFDEAEFAKSRYSKVAFLRDSEDFIGRTLNVVLEPGDTFGPGSFYPEGSGPNVADDLAPGKRAVTITVDGSGMVDGFANAGTIVDVLFRSEKLSDSGLDETTVTLLHAIEVLAVNRTSTEGVLPVDDSGRPLDEVKVTLQVNPAEANVLKAIEGRGILSLALRSSNEPAPEVLNSDLATQTAELDRLHKEFEALTKLKEVSSESGVEFSSGDRLVEVEKLVTQLETSIDDLNAQLEAQKAAEATHRSTLASVLELKPRSVMIAIADIPADRMVRPGDFRTEAVADEDQATTEYRGAAVENPQEFLGRIVSREIKAGDILHPEIFYPEGAGPNIASRLPVGFRAVTVSVPAGEVVDGFAGEGATVDVFFRADAATSEDIPETTLMVLSGIDVLSVDRNPYKTDDAASGDARVALAVPVHEVPKLKALDGRGNLTLALRAADEPTVTEIARKLATAETELKTAQVESRALQQLAELAPKKDGEIQLTAAFTAKQSDRLTELRSRLPHLEQKVASLQDELNAASQKAPMLTLAEALGIPKRIAPAAPRSIELYQGGRKQTVQIGPGSPGVAISPAKYTPVRPAPAPATQPSTQTPARAPQPNDQSSSAPVPVATPASTDVSQAAPAAADQAVASAADKAAQNTESADTTASPAAPARSTQTVADLQASLVSVPQSQFGPQSGLTARPQVTQPSNAARVREQASVQRAEELSAAVLASNGETQAAVESNAQRTEELASSVAVIGSKLETALQVIEQRIATLGQRTEAAVESVKAQVDSQSVAASRAVRSRDSRWKLPLYRGGKVEVIQTPEAENDQAASVSAPEPGKSPVPEEQDESPETTAAEQEVSATDADVDPERELANVSDRPAPTIEIFHGGKQQ